MGGGFGWRKHKKHCREARGGKWEREVGGRLADEMKEMKNDVKS